MVTWSFLHFAVCRDAAQRRTGLSSTADPCRYSLHAWTFARTNLDDTKWCEAFS